LFSCVKQKYRMKQLITLLVVLFTLQLCFAQNSTSIKLGKTTITIEGQEINTYKTRDVRTNDVFTTTNYFNITGTWISFYNMVAEGKTALQVYEYKIPSDTKLTATVEEEQNLQYMQAIAYKVIIKCPAGDLCAVQTVTTKDEAEKLVTTEAELVLYLEEKEFAEKFAAAFK
jgi:hypothetical protein